MDDKSSVLVTIFTQHSDRVVSVAFSPNNQLIASASYDNTIRLWDVTTERVIHTFSLEKIEPNNDPHHNFYVGASSKLSFNKKGDILTLGNGYTTLVSWNINTGKVANILSDRSDYAVGTIFSPDGSLFANALGNNIGIRNVETGQLVNTIFNTDLVFSMAFDNDHKYLVNTNINGKIQLWNIEFQELLYKLPGSRIVTISPNGEFIAGDYQNTIKVWYRQTGEELYSLKSNSNYIQAILFSPNNNILLSADVVNNTIKLWDLTTGQTTATLSSPQVYAVAFSSDSKMIASANFDNTIRIWKIQPEFKNQ